MRPITGLHLNAVSSPVMGEDVKGLGKIRRPDQEEKGRALRPVKKDEYVPEDKKTPSGRYWMDKDENGKLKIHFDDPSRMEDPLTGDKKVGAANKAGTTEYLGDVKVADASGKTAMTQGPVKRPEDDGKNADMTDALDESRKADAPDQKQKAGEPDEDKKADGPDKKQKSEKCVGNTDKVDREIEKLKRKKKELEQKINRESDPDKAEDLKKQLAQVENELRQKDNDGYRRSHTVFH